MGGDGSCVMAMFKMVTSCFSAAFFFSELRCGLDGAGFWRASVRSSATCVTASAGGSLGGFFFSGKIAVVSETHSNSVLGMYDVRHI